MSIRLFLSIPSQSLAISLSFFYFFCLCLQHDVSFCLSASLSPSVSLCLWCITVSPASISLAYSSFLSLINMTLSVCLPSFPLYDSKTDKGRIMGHHLPNNLKLVCKIYMSTITLFRSLADTFKQPGFVVKKLY